MRRFSKVMLIIACVIAVIGIGFSIGGVVMGATLESVDVLKNLKTHRFSVSKMIFWDDEDDDWDDEDNWEHGHHVESGSTDSDGNKVYEIASADEIEIELRYDELIFRSYEGDCIRVEVENDDAGNVKVAHESGELEIRSSKRVRDRKVTVSYPKNAHFKKAEVNVDAGSVELQGDLNAEELKIGIGAGELTGDGSLTAREAEIEVGAGSVEIGKLTAEKLDGECGLGSMSLTLTGKEKDYNYKLEVGLGEISLQSESFSGLANEKKINNGASRMVELECGMGEIDIDFENE